MLGCACFAPPPECASALKSSELLCDAYRSTEGGV
jgi:hypothetical protein